MIEEKIMVNNIALHVRQTLNDKPVILFLHFSGGNSHIWNGVIPLFEKDYRIILPDLRGHGKSDKPLHGYHIDDFASDIYELLKQLKIKTCHVVGSSMGAEIGLSLAAAHPELVLSLVCEGALSNEFGEYGLFQGSEKEISDKKEELWTELAKREERVFSTPMDYVKEEQAELSKLKLWNEHFLAFFENNVQKIENDNYTYCYLNHVRMEYIQKYWDVKFEEYYQNIICPILFLPSEEEWESETVRRNLSFFASLVGTHEIERIDHSIHAYVWMQLPTIAGNVVKQFITKYDNRSE